MSLLSLKNLEASYGYSQALFGIDLELKKGEVLALLGRNGMGKTTTVKAICRMLKSSGVLNFDGHDLHTLQSYKVARLGIGLVPEGRRCFKDLTVYENLIAAAISGKWNFDAICDLFPRLGERHSQIASSLSGGEQQMLAIGRALMTNPRLLMLDEATEGLAPIIRQEIWSCIRQLKAETGLAIIIIDKSLKEIASVADKVVVLERGKTVWSGTIAALTKEVTAQYLGV